MTLHSTDMDACAATGTADVAILIGQKMKELGIDGKVIGVDPSSRMLQKGFFKISDAQLQNVVSLRLGMFMRDMSNAASFPSCCCVACKGDAQQLTISSAFFDKISISFGIRNVNDKLAALKEAHRVIKKHKDSRFCILEFSQPQRGALAPVARLFITHILPWVGSYVAPGHNEEYVHLKQSITDFPPPGEFANLILKAGFQSIEVRDIFFDIVHLYTAIPVDSKSPFTRFLPSVW
jgi:demethylmenaquinone methyltransferase/2-methoxy-6-polyprenyl-1,4-benzoquinol methylase